MFPPVHGHFMSMRAIAAEARLPPPMHDKEADVEHALSRDAAADGPWHSPPGDALEGEAGNLPADNATPEQMGEIIPLPIDSPVR
jgi:hypothetical protein